jgi:hypothetical protein
VTKVIRPSDMPTLFLHQYLAIVEAIDQMTGDEE